MRGIYLFVLIGILIFGFNEPVGAGVLYSDWDLSHLYVGINTHTTINLRDNLDLTIGYLVEGYQHRPEDLQTGLDAFCFEVQRDIGKFTYGKFRPKWGHGPFDSVMLSGYAPGMIGVKYDGEIFGLDYERFQFWISGERGKLFGHRLEVPVFSGVKLGLKETVLYNKDFDNMWLCYVPLWPFYLNKYIPGTGMTSHDNNNIGLDLIVDLEKWLLYFDLHIAEFPLGADKTQPPLYGLKVGVFSEEFFFEDLSLEAEYVRTTNYLYGHRSDLSAYVYKDRPLGSPLGPDAERIGILSGYKFNDNFTLFCGFRWERKGEGQLLDCYFTQEEGEEKEIFLSGIVEERIIPVGGFKYRILPGLEAVLFAEIAFLNNADHEEGKKGTRTSGNLNIKWNF